MIEFCPREFPARFLVLRDDIGQPLFINKYEKILWTRKGVRATVVTPGHCTHAEPKLTSMHAFASCYSCCMHSRGLCQLTS